MDPFTADPSALINSLIWVKEPPSLVLRLMKKPRLLYSEAVSHSSEMAELVMLVISKRTRVTAAEAGSVKSSQARLTLRRDAKSPILAQ